MKRTTFLAIAFVAAVIPAYAQSTTTLIRPASIGLPDHVSIERTVELDGDPATQDFVLADYTFMPTRRALLQVKPGNVVCLGPFSYWFGDNPYIWPTWVTVNGLTKAHWTLPNGDWAIADLDLPACPQ